MPNLARMRSRVWLAAILSVGLVSVPGTALASGSDLTWKGYRGVHPGEALARAAGHLGVQVVTSCGAHAVTAGPVLVDDRASGGDGTASSITTGSRRVRGPSGLHVGMRNKAVKRAVGSRGRTKVVGGQRAYLLKGPHHRVLWTLSTGRSKSARVTEIGLSPTMRTARAAVAAAVHGCPPAVVAPHPPPACPDPLPVVGQFMTASCDVATGQVAYTCHPDWLDQDADAADGCEREVGGLVPMTFATGSACGNQAAQTLTWRIAWAHEAAAGCQCVLDGDCPTDTATWDDPSYTGIRTTPAVPRCSGDTTVAPSIDCPGGVPADPAPAVSLDFSKLVGDDPRVVVNPQDADTDHVTVRFRVSTIAPIAFETGGTTCQLSLDSTPGTTPDFQVDLDLARGADPNGPPVVENLTTSRVETTDWTVNGSVPCIAGSFGAVVSGYVTDVLSGWADRFLTQWCGAPDPYWWQDCPKT